MYECPHDTSMLEGRAGGIFCRACGKLFKSFEEIHPKEDAPGQPPADGSAVPGDGVSPPADNKNGGADNEPPEGEADPGAVSEPPAEDADPAAEAKPKPRNRRQAKEENNNGR